MLHGSRAILFYGQARKRRRSGATSSFRDEARGQKRLRDRSVKVLKSDKEPSGRSPRTRAKPAGQADPQRMRQAAAALRRAYPCIRRHGGGRHPRCAESALHRQIACGGTGTGSLRRRFALTRQAGKMRRAASRLMACFSDRGCRSALLLSRNTNGNRKEIISLLENRHFRQDHRTQSIVMDGSVCTIDQRQTPTHVAGNCTIHGIWIVSYHFFGFTVLQSKCQPIHKFDTVSHHI